MLTGWSEGAVTDETDRHACRRPERRRRFRPSVVFRTSYMRESKWRSEAGLLAKFGERWRGGSNLSLRPSLRQRRHPHRCTSHRLQASTRTSTQLHWHQLSTLSWHRSSRSCRLSAPMAESACADIARLWPQGWRPCFKRSRFSACWPSWSSHINASTW
jgi:hypothetical protein